MRSFIILNFTPCYWGDQIKGDKIAEYVARVGAMRNTYKISIENPEGERQIGRQRVLQYNLYFCIPFALFDFAFIFCTVLANT
jgi:hypothetical protein